MVSSARLRLHLGSWNSHPSRLRFLVSSARLRLHLGKLDLAHAYLAARTMAAKFSSIRMPQRWLFSGWNWVACRAPRETAAGNVSP